MNHYFVWVEITANTERIINAYMPSFDIPPLWFMPNNISTDTEVVKKKWGSS